MIVDLYIDVQARTFTIVILAAKRIYSPTPTPFSQSVNNELAPYFTTPSTRCSLPPPPATHIIVFVVLIANTLRTSFGSFENQKL